MQVGGDELHDLIATACRGVYEDEIEHAEQGASGLERGEWSDEQWALAKDMVEAISRQRVACATTSSDTSSAMNVYAR